MYTCFNCGKIKKYDKCEHCGYEFSLPYKCPRLANNGNSIQCSITKKMCRERDFEICPILRKHD